MGENNFNEHDSLIEKNIYQGGNQEQDKAICCKCCACSPQSLEKGVKGTMVFILIGAIYEIFNLIYYFENRNFDYRLVTGYALIYAIYLAAFVLSLLFLCISSCK